MAGCSAAPQTAAFSQSTPKPEESSGGRARPIQIRSEEFTAAPIAWNGLVFIGPAGGDFGIRGRVAAFDAQTGREVWRFHTIPEGGEAGAETWTLPATVKHGGGGTWTSYTLDPVTRELFVPVGNPAPGYAPEKRPGANLYTNSVVVLDAATGKLKWFYQLDPNDGFDWDLGAAPMLYQDGPRQGRVALGSKDGHVYVLDRQSHKLLFKTEVTTISVRDAKPALKGTNVCPGALGGVEWNGPSYSPLLNTIYVGAVDWCFVELEGKTARLESGLSLCRHRRGSGRRCGQVRLDHGHRRPLGGGEMALSLVHACRRGRHAYRRRPCLRG